MRMATKPERAMSADKRKNTCFLFTNTLSGYSASPRSLSSKNRIEIAVI
jgi:hypothetical protein